MNQIKTVTVLGANGAMGRNISIVYATLGNAKVYMVARKQEAAEDSVRRAQEKIEDEAVRANLIPKTYEDLPACLAESEMIFESVAENIETKTSINEKIAKYAREDAIIATGTSGLSIQDLADCFEGGLKARYTGTHFFNPPTSLTLCEVIPNKDMDPVFLKEYKDYLKNVLKRAVVQTQDEAGFLGNRIGFQFMNEALQMAEAKKELGGIDYIDAILGQFSGRSLAPLATADFVGLDVHKAIVDNLYDATNDYAHETFKLPKYVQQLVDEDKLGRKKGIGLYQTIIAKDGSKIRKVYDIAASTYRDVKKYDLPFAKNMIEELQAGNFEAAMAVLKEDASDGAKLCLTFLLKYILYSVVISLAVAESANDADTAMVTGFSWAPPLGVMEALGGAQEVKAMIKEDIEPAYRGDVDLDAVFDQPMRTEYDYKKFFKPRGDGVKM